MISSVRVWVVNYKSANVLRELLADLDTEAEVAGVVVLDNGSPEEDVRELLGLAQSFPKLTVERSEQNLGFGAGHNRIAALTRARSGDGEAVWLLNPDMRVSPGTTAAMLEVLSGTPGAVVSPTITTRRGNRDRIWFSGGYVDCYAGRVEDSQLGRDPAMLSEVPDVVSTKFVSGAAPLMTRATWDHIGGFDETLFLYWEDVEWSLRAVDRGHDLVVETKHPLFHHEGASSKGDVKARARAYYFMSRNRMWICRSRGASVGRLLFGTGVPALIRMAAFTVRRDGRGRLRRIASILRGTLDGARTPYVTMSARGAVETHPPTAGNRPQEGDAAG